MSSSKPQQQQQQQQDEEVEEEEEEEKSSTRTLPPRPKGRRGRKDKKAAPSRPLSAYNLFFQKERSRILQEIDREELRPDFVANSAAALKRAKSQAAAQFQAIASTIATRWKATSAADRAPYEKLAVAEMERYKQRKDEFHRNLVRECQMVGQAASLLHKNKASTNQQEQQEHEQEQVELQDSLLDYKRPALRQEPGTTTMGTVPTRQEASSRTLLLPEAVPGANSATTTTTTTNSASNNGNSSLAMMLNAANMSIPPSLPQNTLLDMAHRQRWLTTPNLPNHYNDDSFCTTPTPTNTSLPWALMMRQVEAEHEIVRLQELVNQLRRQREMVQSTTTTTTPLGVTSATGSAAPPSWAAAASSLHQDERLSAWHRQQLEQQRQQHQQQHQQQHSTFPPRSASGATTLSSIARQLPYNDVHHNDSVTTTANLASMSHLLELAGSFRGNRGSDNTSSDQQQQQGQSQQNADWRSFLP